MCFMLSVLSTGGCRNIGHQHAKEHGSLLMVKADMLAYRGSGTTEGLDRTMEGRG